MRERLVDDKKLLEYLKTVHNVDVLASLFNVSPYTIKTHLENLKMENKVQCVFYKTSVANKRAKVAKHWYLAEDDSDKWRVKRDR
jgi:predicted ArsR family transcriptional regulator